MRKICAFLTILLISFSLFASEPINAEELVQIVKTYATAVGASYAALSQVDLPGVAISRGDSFIPYSIALKAADLYSFKEPLSRKSFMPLSLSRPFAGNAIREIDELNAKEGAYIADGTVYITKNGDISLLDILSSNLSAIDISATFDVVLYGTMLDGKIALSGETEAKGNENGEVEISFSQLRIGGYDVFVPAVVSNISF